METRWAYLWHKSHVRVALNGTAHIAATAKIKYSRIYVGPGCMLTIDEDVSIKGISINITNGGVVNIGKGCLLLKDRNAITPEYIIDNGILTTGTKSLIQTWRIWCRFKGKLTIGDYTNINFGSEIRCDDSVTIGDYCQISYNVKVWDTNTHNIYPSKQRRELTRAYFPGFGKEFSSPKSSPIKIGNDCWIGEGCSILKGSTIGDRAIVGHKTIVTGQTLPPDSVSVMNIELHTFNYRPDE